MYGHPFLLEELASNRLCSQEIIRKMEKGIGGLLKLSRGHFTVVLLANAHPNAYVLALLVLSFLPCIILHVCYC
jgi:hypothetical protein